MGPAYDDDEKTSLPAFMDVVFHVLQRKGER